MRPFSYLLLFFSVIAIAQENPEGGYTVDANYFYGNIIPHRKSIQHLITDHPNGVVISFNCKTFGKHEWEQAYGFPDYGVSLHYQDMKNEVLGEMYGLYGHYNFYFLNRQLVFRLGQGVAYNTNPYDKQTNFRNYAYGMHVMPSTYFMLNYNRQNLWHGLGLQAGLIFIHHSNASMKSPNTSTNTFAVNVGLNYTFESKEDHTYNLIKSDSVYKQPLHYNIVFRGGVNQSDVIGTKQYPYFALSGYIDKRISRKSGLQLGADIFWPKYLKEYIHYMSIAYPEEKIDGSADYKKVGLFGGYELYVNKMSLEGQVGYYVYSPFNATGRLYQRVGMKYYISKNVFGSLGLKTHGAKAEVMEFGLGVRL
ncbi:acyloxyacyl hydrolase [Flavobacterium sp. Sd200]|uniref:acyloxyacyl hydrolase n=1 Tax=Flavobacterium sp. Sd200 TaxID=2692211 RepID=UPI0013721B7C|nr:acyloxyacyl hydrolase [Flavobacterium sp. Sd200]MXN91777.1 acyloxyacyl hydrolase [Flavobacterium sp. Sd200]